MRYTGFTIALFAACTLLTAPGGAQQPPAPTEPVPPAPVLVSMATASITGVYFPVGVALCRLVNQHRPETGVRCSARPSDGSVANIAALRSGDADLAIVQSDTQAAAFAGTGSFAAAGPFTDLRSVMALYPEPLTLVARSDAGIAAVEDLAGKRVWRGTEGSGTRALADGVTGALGWSESTFADIPDISADRVADALCSGELDAFFYAIGQPALVFQEATIGCDSRLVPIGGAAIDAFVAANPGLVQATIPGGLYRNNPAPVASFGAETTLVTRANEPEDRLHAMLGQIFDEFDTLRGLEPVLANLDPATMASPDLVAPLHPGAERYFRERGWIN